MTNLEMWSLIVGFALPLILAVIQRPHWPSWVRAVVAFAAFVVVGLGTAYFNGDLNGKSIVSAVLFVLVTAITSYKGLWQPTGIAPKIESATTPNQYTNRLAA